MLAVGGDVVERVGVNVVLPGPAVDPIGRAVGRLEHVVPIAAVHDVRAAAADDHVVSASPDEGIRARVALEVVVSVATDHVLDVARD